jgi:predicted exporter
VVEWLQAHRARGDDDGAATGAAGGADGTPADALVTGYQALSAFLPSRATERARRAAFAALPLDRAREALGAELRRQNFRVAAFDDATRAFGAVETAALPRPDGDARDGTRPGGEGPADWLAPFLRRHVGTGVMRGSADATTGGPAVLIAVPFQPAPGVTLDAIRDRLRAEVDPGVVVTGRALMQDALATVIAREVILFTVLTVVLNLLIVVPQTRSWRLAWIVMAPTIVIVGALLTGMHLTGVAFTPLNLVVLPLTLGIGVDNCVYLVARIREGFSVEDATRLTGRAIAVTTLTTTAGFGFLSVSRYPGLAGLGWLAAVAIGLTFVAAVVIQPAFLVLDRRTLAEGARHPHRLDGDA